MLVLYKVYSENQAHMSNTGVEIISLISFTSNEPIESIVSRLESKEVRWQQQPLGQYLGKAIQVGKVFDGDQEITDYYYVLEPFTGV